MNEYQRQELKRDAEAVAQQNEKVRQEINGKIRAIYLISANCKRIQFRFSLTSTPFGARIILGDPIHDKVIAEVTPHFEHNAGFDAIVVEVILSAQKWYVELSDYLNKMYLMGQDHSKGQTIFVETLDHD